MDYEAQIKASLLLPKTDFPMRAELPKREPAFLARWREENIYGKILAARAEAAKDRTTTFVLHDGPPFANGDAHMGHALNMVLKDLVLKSHNMRGHYTPFIPGWDCHGLPIEHKVMKDLAEAAKADKSGKTAVDLDPVQIREKCAATARHFIGVQSEQFQRLGVFGDWKKPYLTLDPGYEAATLRVFAQLVKDNLIYQGLRPVHWSTGCQTALAEAEIEYKEKIDPAIYVKFPLTAAAAQKFPQLDGASLLIWTTTPWTLPANLAVAVAPNLDYAVHEIAGEKLLLHPGLAAKIPNLGEMKISGAVIKGSELAELTYVHPFLTDGRERKIYTGDFVTADAGTGLVHIAPGHGQDDYQLGQEHGLPVLAPVDDRGCLTEEAGVPELVGVYVFKANPLIIEILKGKNLLWAAEEYRHEYPHCWRSKTPIVFRAVKQWFIKLDDVDPQKNIRARALAAIDDQANLQFVPESGRKRIRGGVESRPDWCISRQRTWGVPLPVFYIEEGTPILREKIILAFADLVEKEGSGIWFSLSSAELVKKLKMPGNILPLGAVKGKDTLDVWIDSGTSWKAVVEQRLPGLFPADLYLEGSDQHRGWFQSSLLTSIAGTGKAPYRAVLTNGFVVDIEGKKLSKSATGYQKPIDLMSLVNEHGADVLRLWVASQDFQDDIPFSNDIFARVADSYRSIRNTLRILLGNLADFDPKNDAVPLEKWTLLDRYFHEAFLRLAHAVKRHYEAYEFSQVYQAINRFCAVDLSSQYVDLLKDRMYCHAQNDVVRRAAQTVLHQILLGLTQLLAPILPFTCEETWQFAGQSGSVHEQLFPPVPSVNGEIISQGQELLELRSRVNEKIEALRREKIIGKSLEARVEIVTKSAAVLEAQPALLAELLIVSQVVVTPGDEEQIAVSAAKDAGLHKCVRCWKYYPEVTTSDADAEKKFPLCARCGEVMAKLKFA